MVPRRIAAVALVVLLAGGGAAYTMGAVGAPTVGDVENRFAGVNESTTLVRTNLTIENPNPIGIDAGGIVVDYTVDIGGVELAAGQRRGISVGTGSQTLTFLTAMSNERIPEWWVAHLRNGERSELRVHVDVRATSIGPDVSATPVERPIETDVLSSFNSTDTREIRADVPLVDDTVLYVNETAGWWGDVSRDASPMEMRFTVYNPQQVPYTVTAIGYDVTMNDVRMGEGRTDREYVLEPRTTTTLRATAVLENEKLDEWWVTHVRNDEVTDLRIDFYALVELPTGNEVWVPLEEIAHDVTIETDIFQNGDTAGADESTTDESTPGETDAGTETTDDNGLEPTSTDDATTDGNESTDGDGGLL